MSRITGLHPVGQAFEKERAPASVTAQHGGLPPQARLHQLLPEQAAPGRALQLPLLP
nr:hypothetical protein [Pseudomonas aeruginosa]